MFRKLRIGNAGKAFAVAVEPLTQIDTIAKYPIQLYGTNAVVGMVNGLFITYMGCLFYTSLSPRTWHDFVCRLLFET
ncbi:hypothetical protein [Streptococcus suis]